MKISEWRELCQKQGRHYLDWSERPARSVSIYFTIIFAKLGITANQLSTFNVFVSIAAGILYATNLNLVFLALILQFLNHIWDSCDGELARYRNQGSLTGLYLDRLGSWYLYPAILFGIGIGVGIELDSLLPILLGALGGFAMLQGRLVIAGPYWCAADAIFHQKQTAGIEEVKINDFGDSERDIVKNNMDNGIMQIPYWIGDFLFSRTIGLDISMLTSVIVYYVTNNTIGFMITLLLYGIGGSLAALIAAVMVVRNRQSEQFLASMKEMLKN